MFPSQSLLTTVHFVICCCLQYTTWDALNEARAFQIVRNIFQKSFILVKYFF